MMPCYHPSAWRQFPSAEPNRRAGPDFHSVASPCRGLLDRAAATARLACAGLIASTVLWSANVARAGLYETNLLGNPGFEDYYTGSAASWQNGSSAQYDLQASNTAARGAQSWINAGTDICAIRTDGPATGHSGNYYGTGGDSSLPAGTLSRMRQDVDLLACGFSTQELDTRVLVLDAGAWLSSAAGDPDSVEVRVYFLDASRTLLALAYRTSPRNHDAWTWYESGRVAVVSGTRFVRFDIEFTRQTGSTSDGRVDDTWVRVAPSADLAGPLLDRNLIANPGFEAGSSSWPAVMGNPRARLTGLDSVPAHSGQWFLFGGQRPLSPTQNHAAAAQDITLPYYGVSPDLLAESETILFLQLSAWISSFGDVGNARLRLDIQDDGGASLLQYDTGRIRSDKHPAPFQWQHRLPPTAQKIILTLDMLDPAGTNLDGYFDDVALVITRTPHRPIMHGPFVAGHRGNSIAAPENTVASFAAVHRLAQFGELDTYVCSSGELVVMHDSTVDRTTEGTGSISALTLAQIKQLDAGVWFSPEFTGERVPTLEEVIHAMQPDVTPLIERKGGSAAAHLAELQRLGVQHSVVVQCFDWSFLAELHALDPLISLGALYDGPLTIAKIDQAKAAGAGFIALSSANVNAQSLAQAHAAGLQLVVWTVDDVSAMQQFIDMGIDGIITNHPTAASWLTNPSLSPADLDADGDVDQVDLALFNHCRTGAGVPSNLPSCDPADLDGDLDVDQADFGLLQRCLAGSGLAAPPGCSAP